jgi:hypothetical protein
MEERRGEKETCLNGISPSPSLEKIKKERKKRSIK